MIRQTCNLPENTSMNTSTSATKLTLACLLAAFAACSECQALDIFVHPTGDDTQPGTNRAPVATLARAQQLARNQAGQESVTVNVADGIYYLPNTLTFESVDSGTEAEPIVYRAENEGGAVLSGGSKLQLAWQSYRDGIYSATTPEDIEIDQLFVGGRSQRMARYPNYDATKSTAAYQGFSADAFSKDRAADWSDPAGGYIHAMHRSRWGGYHYRITGKDASGEVTYEGGWQNNRQMGMHKDFRMVENIFEELDAPGEWFHDAKNNTLFYIPEPNVDLSNADVEVVRLKHLIEFRGNESSPVKFVTLQGFTFRHAARTFMETKEPLLRSDWTIYRGGAITLTGTENVQVTDCEFDQLGGNAVFASNYNRKLIVRGCHIHDCGASGVCFVGDPNAVRDPLFEYRQKNDLSKIDIARGPKTNNYPADCLVDDCLINGIGRVERQPAGVQISMAARITVRYCSIYDCARSGINIGDGTWGGHLVEHCDVFDTVQETHDHGSFNSWGRDRFWHSDRSVTQVAVDKNPKLPYLDAMETTVLRNNRMRCDHGWDIDLDDGSTNYHIYNNLLLSGGLKLREGFGRKAWNNITINNGLHPHVWYSNSDDEVYGNLFMVDPKGARMPTQKAKGKRVDENFYYSNNPDVKDKYAAFGWDKNSIVGDAGFIDPASGDFRVKKDSRAFSVGFKNFPMDQFGVRKPSLKAIASTPVLPTPDPELRVKSPYETKSAPLGTRPSPSYKFTWLGADIKSMVGEEFSAFGVSRDSGGVVVSQVAPDCDAASLGLLAGDLIQKLNGNQVKTVSDLVQSFTRCGSTPLSAIVIRNQESIMLQSGDLAYVTVETNSDPKGFAHHTLPGKRQARITTSVPTKNEPVSVLSNGRLAEGYGPVFPNNTAAGVYRLDMGRSKPLSIITSWSTHLNGRRGAQKLTLYASNSKKDPGWPGIKNSTLKILASIDTTSQQPQRYTAVALRARKGKTLGTFRWIYWQVSPINKAGEHTAFQELDAE